jgi:ankyrin repeat protein
MDYLCECNNDRDRRDALKKLPPDLPSSYERILERVNRSTKENRDLVMKTLHWIIYSQRTLTTEQLLHALAVRDGERHFDSNSMTTVEDVLHWCSSLVRRPRRVDGLETLELAHFTVKEFLEAIDAVQTPCYKQYCLSGDHSTLAKACLNVLLCQEFDGFPPPKNDNDLEQWIEESDNFCENYLFIDYASIHWSNHVHESNWEVISSCVMDFFSTESAFAFWTLRWLLNATGYNYANPDFEYSCYFEKSSSPTALHWAAVFALDKVCAILIEKGISVSKQSVLGTPLNCAIVSEYALYEKSEIPNKGSIEGRSIWRRSERQSVLRQFINTGLDLDEMVNAEGQCTAMSVALALESMHVYPFIVSTLLDAGAKISVEDFGSLYTDLHNISEDYLFEDTLDEIVAICGITMPSLINIATAQKRALVHGAEFEFFSFSLEVLSCGWSLECLHPLFEVKLSEVFAAYGGVVMDEIIRDDSIDPRSRLVKLLSTAIRNSAPTKEKADSRLQDSLTSTVRYRNPSIMALLFQHNIDLSASGLKLPNYGKDKEIGCLHWVLRYGTSTGHKEGLIRLLISHGASVTNPDGGGSTAIELAAEDCDLEIFQVMWDSAMSSKAFHTSRKLLKKILCSAIKYQKEPLLKLLVRKLHESKLMLASSMLELAVGRKTSSLLELILEQEDNFNCYQTDSCIFGDKMEEENEKDCAKVLKCNWDGGNQYMEHEIDTTAGRKSYHHEALYLAAKPRGSVTNFKFLVNLGLPASHHHHNGHTILHILAANHDENALFKLQYLLEKSRLMLDLLNSDYLTPLALAVRSRNIRGMERLLDAGANLDTLLAGNQTALHVACYSGNKAAAEALLRRGCHTSQKDLQGQTPMDLALACGYQEIATTIQNFIDSDLTRNSSHTFGAKIERLSTITTSNFAQTDDHGSLPLRTVQEDLDSDHDSEDGINANNFTTNIGNDRIAESSKQSTDSVRRSHLPQTNISEDFASPSLKRHTSNGDEYQLQLSTKRAKSS